MEIIMFATFCLRQCGQGTIELKLRIVAVSSDKEKTELKPGSGKLVVKDHIIKWAILLTFIKRCEL